MAKISTILDEIDNGSIALPVFQRGYVWSRKQVSELFASLYRGHPIGSLLIWKTSSIEAEIRGDLSAPSTPLQLLLDGQQRMTSLYGVMRGKEPAFFDGNANAFRGLRFNMEEESFEFYQPVRMRDDPLWIDVSELYKNGTDGVAMMASNLGDGGQDFTKYMGRLLRLLAVSDKELHIELVTGEDKTVETVVDIFNQVNSGGTKLTSGDLALAKICAGWPQARENMKSLLEKWSESGYDFDLDWLLRVANAIITGEARFIHLRDVPYTAIRDGLDKAEKHINTALKMISDRTGLDHTRVLFAKPAIAVIAALLESHDGDLSPEQRDRLLYWYVHAGMWGRYSSAAESTLNRDLGIIQSLEHGSDPIDNLIEELRLSRGGLDVEAQHFHGWGQGARFYSVLYLITRIGQARDFNSGLPLRRHQLGRMSQLELHHIFPKSKLYQANYSKQEVNALANFCFLTREANASIGNRLPSDYFPEIENRHPGILESQWIPSDPRLWEIDEYTVFLETRRELLANATNEILNSFLTDHPYMPSETDDDKIETSSLPAPPRPSSIKDDEEEALLIEINDWIKNQGLQPGIMGYELVHPVDGAQLAIFDLAWPDGVQHELSEPVALLINEGIDVLIVAGSYGYRFFTNTSDFKKYISEEILLYNSETDLQELVARGESGTVEFKSTLRTNLHTGNSDKKMESEVLKTLAGFLNTEGGTLLIGIADDGSSFGIQSDSFSSEDKMNLHLVNLVKSRMVAHAMTKIHINFEGYHGNRIMKVECDPSHTPVYVKEGNEERFYVRMGASTDYLPPSQIPDYIKTRFE